MIVLFTQFRLFRFPIEIFLRLNKKSRKNVNKSIIKQGGGEADN